MQVKWYKRATKMLDSALKYALDNFGELAAIRFYGRIKHFEALLAANPQIGRIEPLLSHRKREYRSIVVHDCFKLIYYIGSDSICIIALWNCRQNPNRLGR